MRLTALRLRRIDLTVCNLARAEVFYASLGFETVAAQTLSPGQAAVLGAMSVRELVLRRGAQEIALQEFDPPGAPYPADASACDQSFQHFALPVADIEAAVARLPPVASISRGGPQLLPQRSGGATAFKFRDPDGHPLELIQFPDGHTGGIDHSAIAVADAARSIAFYRDWLGLRLDTQQINTGPEQDRLDGLDGTVVDVIALQPQSPTPHLELLAYRSPAIRPARPSMPADIVATRLMFDVSGPLNQDAELIDDPDGHKLLLRC